MDSFDIWCAFGMATKDFKSRRTRSHSHVLILHGLNRMRRMEGTSGGPRWPISEKEIFRDEFPESDINDI